jgi:hypothetical protein
MPQYVPCSVHELNGYKVGPVRPYGSYPNALKFRRSIRKGIETNSFLVIL